MLLAGGLACGGPKASEPKASAEVSAKPASAKSASAQPASDAGSPPAPPPKPDPSLQLEAKRVYLFHGIGRGFGPASLLQENFGYSFTTGIEECVKQHGVRGRFTMMLLTKPDKGELEFNGVKGPTVVTKAFADCTKPVWARAQIPKGERFDGMLMIEYEAK